MTEEYNTEYPKNSVLGNMICELDLNDIKDIFKANSKDILMLKAKCNINPKEKIDDERAKRAKEAFLKYYKNDKNLKDLVLSKWVKKNGARNEKIKTLLTEYNNLEQFKTWVSTNMSEKDMLSSVLLLWKHDECEFNLYGDELYREYLKTHQNPIDSKNSIDSKDSATIDVRQNEINKLKQKISNLEKNLKSKENEMNCLKKEISLLSYNKEVKKQLKTIDINIGEINKKSEEQSKYIDTEFNKLQKQLDKLDKLIIHNIEKDTENINRIINALNNATSEQDTKNIEVYISNLKDDIITKLNQILENTREIDINDNTNLKTDNSELSEAAFNRNIENLFNEIREAVK